MQTIRQVNVFNHATDDKNQAAQHPDVDTLKQSISNETALIVQNKILSYQNK